ncbi:MAG: ATP-binding protein [Candidatus Binatia bacterium]
MNKIMQLVKHPFTVAAGVAIVAIWLWAAFLAEQRMQVERTIRKEAANVRNEIIARVQSRILALTRLSRQWEERGRPTQKEWEAAAELNYGSFPGYQAIAWLDPWLLTRWVVPSLGGEVAREIDMLFRERQRQVIEAVLARREVVVTGAIDLAPGKKGFLAYVPIFREGGFDGTIAGIFVFQELFSAILHENLAPEYSVVVLENEREIYSHTDSSRKYELDWAQEVSVDLYDLHWSVRIWPRRKPLAGARSLLPSVVLVGGLVLAGLLGFLTYLARTARARTKEVEAANRLKSDLLATMSHELRTPVNLIMGYTELLLQQNFGRLAPEQEEPLRRVERSAASLRDLITALLDVCRMEAAQEAADLRPVHLGEVMAEVEEEVQELNEKPTVRYLRRVPEVLPPVYSDRTKLKVVLKNLLSNAVKFTERGRITVDAYLRNEGVVVTVSDTGIGIEPDVLPEIFDMFRQGDSSITRRYGGMGIGLYVVRRLLDLMGGKVEVESKVGQGSTFRVWIPRNTPEEEPRETVHVEMESETRVPIGRGEYA